MYCTLEDMVNRFGLEELIQLTDSSGTGIIDNDEVNAAVDDASNLIDGYLGGRYTLPLTSVPSVLIRICANIARYNLYDSNVSEVVERNYKDALTFLDAVGKGTLKLGLAADDSQPESEQLIEIESQESVFKRDDSKGFI